MKLRQHSGLIGLLLGIFVTFPACLIAFVSSGAGHGDYFAFKLVYPITMLSALMGSITLPFVVTGLLQYPLYGYFIGHHWRSEERAGAIRKVAVFHVVLALLAVGIPNPSFS